jgi:hypothetical protein
MNIVISLVECPDGTWSVCRDAVALLTRLRLGPAIKHARELARDQHGRTGERVSVILTGSQPTIQLACYGAEPVAA